MYGRRIIRFRHGRRAQYLAEADQVHESTVVLAGKHLRRGVSVDVSSRPTPARPDRQERVRRRGRGQCHHRRAAGKP